MTYFQHAIRVVLLMTAVAALLAWDLRHNDASSAEGLRSIRQAEEIHRGEWRHGLIGSMDHPVHPLGVVAMHGIVGGTGPVSWQRAAVALAYACTVLLAIPAYLLTREIFGDRSAWLGAALLLVHPVLGQVVANVMNESSFLLFWTGGLWAAVRFLRDGRFGWLLATVALGVIAFLVRPEGLLLPLALAATLLLLPLAPTARINWPRWRAALSLVVLGSSLLAGPYLMFKGKVGTRPAIARVLGLAASAQPEAIERDRPLPADQSTLATYVLAVGRVARVLRGIVPLPLAVLSLVGLAMMPTGPVRTRLWIFLGVILATSCLGLVRLHATGGYAATRHGLIPGSILLLAAAHGLVRLTEIIAIPGNLLGLGRERFRPGLAIWSLLIVALIAAPRWRSSATTIPGPFHAYRDAAAWLIGNTSTGEQVLDMTDWSLYFSGRSGHRFAQFHEAPSDPNLRWVVVRQSHLKGHRSYTRVLHDLIGDQSPIAALPIQPGPGQIQVLIFERRPPDSALAGGPGWWNDRPAQR